MAFPNLTWNWVEMCGPGGMVPWYPTKHDIGACFQQLFLQIPVLVLFAVVSAYYYGFRHHRHFDQVHRKWIIRLRLFCSVCNALLPMIRAIVGVTYLQGMFRPADYLTIAVEIMAWSVHSGYIISLRYRSQIHGPILVRVLWTLTAVLSVINLRTFTLGINELGTASFGFALSSMLLQVLYSLTFFTACFSNIDDSDNYAYNERSSLISSHYTSFREEVDPHYLGIALNDTTTTSKLTFHWVNSLLKKGSENKLRAAGDLYDLPNSLNTSSLCLQLQTSMVLPRNASTNLLIRGLHKCFGLEFYSVGVLKLISDILGFCGPIILNKLVLFIEERNDNPSSGYLLVGALFLTTFFSAIFNTHFTFRMAQVGLKMRGALVSSIYRKTLSISYSAINSFTVGEIVNFMSTDTDRIVNACPSFHTFWSIPLQIAVSFYLLYLQVGISFLAGVAFAVCLIPINKLIAGKIAGISRKMMGAKDKRVSAMSEILGGIRVLKLHVWEEHFLEKVLGIRDKEIKFLKQRKYLDALCVYFWASTPVLVSFLTLGTYVLLGNELDAATVFTTVALLNMLIGPLNSFPWVLNGLIEAWVSVQRIQKLLDVPNLELDDYYTTDGGYIELKNCNAEWYSLQNDQGGTISPAPFGIQEITLSIKKGQLVGVIGAMGSGKTTFLHALLGELTRNFGDISIPWKGGFGFASQTPWLQRGTLRENILFGKAYDSKKYKAVLDACCLTEDLSSQEGGDVVRIGESGMTLSGGQRARLALARAVYQDKDIYLLDDVLSALDPPVARHVYNKVICGLLKDKTRILCTNNVNLLANADVIVQMDKGKITNVGTPSDVIPNFEEHQCGDTDSVASYKETRDTVEPEKDDNDETSETGAVRASIYRRYWLAIGSILCLTILASLLLMQTSRNATDFWLSVWVSASNTTIHSVPPNYYLFVYISLAISNTFFTLIRAFLFAYGGIRAALVIHNKLLNKVMFSQMTFFDLSPIGRILNRFSSDTYTVDDSLPFITNILCAQMFGLLGSLAITIYGLPWLCLLIIPLGPIYHYIQAKYRPSARDLKRLSSTTLSPLYNHFNETLHGLATIRAFKSIHRFQERNVEYLENNQRALFSGYAANTWLGFRLQMMGVVMVTGVAGFAVLQHQVDVIAPAIVGLTVAYALSITNLLSGVVSAFAETEREFVALERVSEYIEEIKTEPICNQLPPFAWPSQGVIIFDSVYLRYRENRTPILNGVSFETRPAEKIGVVGRTGAGKSSLITALVRLVDIYDGHIRIDTVDIKTISQQSLRQRIAVIPQDPYLFQGTIRSNLDPLGEYFDQALWDALEKCQIRKMVVDIGGLKASVETNGRNFSQGERQLFCLARAVLKNSKIVCIDEATASVDDKTDRLIQQTIRSCFRQSTVLTIAHRISTVMDSDRLIVLRDGEIVEIDTPGNLAFDKTSYFYKLSQRS